jgi:hypothetical protein
MVSDVALDSVILFAIIVGICEWVLLLRWNPRYFRKGPVVFKKTLSISEDGSQTFSATELEEHTSLCSVSNIVFRQLGKADYAFQERPLTYMPIMRGHLHIDQKTRLVVVGRLNFTTVLFSLVFFRAFVGSQQPYLAILALCALLTVFYLIQCHRFAAIAKCCGREVKGT